LPSAAPRASSSAAATSKGKAKAAEIGKATGAKVVYVKADLGKVEDACHVVRACDEAFGRVDALVNAAAITDRGTILDTSPELFDRHVCRQRPRAVLPDAGDDQDHAPRKDRGHDRQYRLDVGQGRPALHCRLLRVQGRLETLTKNTAYALLRNRIRVNGLNIGWMASEGEDRIQREFTALPADWLEKAAASQPFGRLVDPEEVARACAYLSSAESGLMTGSVICFDQSIWGATTDRRIPPDPFEKAPEPVGFCRGGLWHTLRFAFTKDVIAIWEEPFCVARCALRYP
jgi:hypothetical protein